MRPINLATPAQAAEIRRRLSGQVANKAKGRPLNGYREERLIDEKYTRPEPGAHIFEVPCYLPTPNEAFEMTKMLWNKKTGKPFTRHYLIFEWKETMRKNILSAFARHVPYMCVDQDRESLRIGRAKKLRASCFRLVLSRIAPVKCAPDAAVGCQKYVIDLVTTWLANGPVFDVNKIGDADDDLIYSPMNPTGPIELIIDQVIRPAKTGKQVMASLPPEVRRAMKARGEVSKPLLGRFGVQIELHLREDSLT